MPRRKADLVEELFNLMLAGPVWLGPALAAFAFGFCRFYLPWAFSGSGSSNPGVTAVQQGMKAFIQPLARTGSWWVLGFFLLLWLCTLGARANRRRVYERVRNLSSTKTLPWQEFESLVAEHYRREGYAAEERGGSNADGGIDLILRRNGETTLVQCKRWNGSVGVEPVRQLLGVVVQRGATGGVFITSGRFTRAAREFAATSPITLIDGIQLTHMINRMKANANSKALVGSFSSETQRTKPDTSVLKSCPACGSPMVIRTARKGRSVGSQFWGCSRYPTCKATQNTVV